MKLFLNLTGFIGLSIVALLVFTLWPLRPFLSLDFLSSKHLLIFTNEAEARPCGGFVTAVGTVQILPPHLSVKNSYALATSLGPAEPPLTQVADQKYFWDLGVNPDLEVCSQHFREAYQTLLPETKFDKVILIDFATIESTLRLFDSIKLNGDKVPTKDVFASLSRLVADVDRHDEQTLQNRKKPLVVLAQSLFWKLITHPLKMPKATTLLGKSLQNGQVFISGQSPDFAPSKNNLSVVEWNLGGAKTSRSLKKTLKIVAREVAPDQWGWLLKFSAEHLGGFDEPLSQDWKGLFEFRLPDFLGGETIVEEMTLPPGEIWTKMLSFEAVPFPVIDGGNKAFSVFVPRGQQLYADVSVSLFSQKSFAEASFDSHENIGEFFGMLKGGAKVFSWKARPDKISPFITLHEVVSADHVASQTELDPDIPFWAEIHFNEPVLIPEGVKMSLVDRDFENKEVSEHPELRSVRLLEDGRTLILGFWQSERQKNERYYLEIEGVRDLWGNVIVPQKRTLVDRR